MSVTLLIPTFNRAHALRSVWSSYTSQSGIDAIVFVDDASTDDTAALLLEIAASSPIPVTIKTHTERLGQQRSRATAIAAADTDWVFFGEDDVWLTPGYVATLLREAETTEASAIAGRIINFKVGRDLDPTVLRDDFSEPTEARVFNVRTLTQYCHLRPSKPIEAPFLHTIALINRSVLNEIAFDPGYKGNGIREETDFYLALNSGGRNVIFTGDALCYHLRGPICGSGGHRMNRLKGEFWTWRNTWRLIYKHRRVLREKFGEKGAPFMMFAAWGWSQLKYLARQVARRERSSFT